MHPREVARRRSSLRRLLIVGKDARGMTDRSLHPSLVATYRLRVVAVGALITGLALVNLLIYMAFDGHRMDTHGYSVVTALGIVELAGLVLTPWNRVLVTRWAMRVLYAWSLFGLAIVALSVYYDGGGESPMFVMLPVLIVFFAVAYPARAQVVLFGAAMVLYVGAVWLRGWELSAAEIYIRIASLAVMAYVSSVLSSWLVSEMLSRARSLSTAEQRAGMLDTVARAVRRVSSLDESQILSSALNGAMELGAFEAEIWLLEGKPPTLKLQRRVAVDMTSPNSEQAALLLDKAKVSRTTQVVRAGRNRTFACLIHKERNVAGVMIVKMHDDDQADSLVLECIELLAAQVSTGLDVARNVAERRGLEERLAHWAFHDSLTDLPNRVLFADRLELALARTARDSSQVAVLFLDLDGFKQINDTLGHAIGDELLHTVANRLKSSLRPNDTLARYGGDEFVVLIEQVEGPRFAALVAQRILDALEVPVVVAGNELLVKTSVGIALAGARPGADADVLRRADIAMYQAKAAGGSRYVMSKGPGDMATSDQ